MADRTALLEAEFGIDAQALLTRHRAERDRRLRSDGLGQYATAGGDLAHYRDDPWADPGFTRAALTDDVEVVVVGGGLGGLLLGAQLRRAGIADIRIVERGADFGGVWYWNRYPGAACDTQAILYMPMLEELGIFPPSKFATQPEIMAHWRRIGETFDLYETARFQTEVTGLTWDEPSRRWIVRTNRGDVMRARFVAIALGPMERPKLPRLPGLHEFSGRSFHTSRWDYGYTGGSTKGSLDRLADKTVGIIGTGATSIQCVPHLAESARQLYVFQRTPSSVDVKGNADSDPALIERLGPGWQRQVMENFTMLVSGILADHDLINDGWTSVMTNIRHLVARQQAGGEQVDNPMAFSQLADYMKMDEIRRRVDTSVQDHAVAVLLKPWYNRFCKRPCFSDEYLPSFNRPNVTLVDTSAGKGVERVTQSGVVVDGRDYPLDCLIFSTGFEVGVPFAQRVGYDIVGCNGLTLIDHWSQGARTQHGFLSHGFPNLFIMSTVHTGVSLNFAHTIDEQARHIAFILGRAHCDGAQRIEVTHDAEEAWCAEIDRAAISQIAFQSECTPSYFNFEGELHRFNVRNSQYGGGPLMFYKMLAAWRAQASMPGLDLKYAK